MAPKRSNNRSTDYSLGLLNNINAPGRDAQNTQDPKRRRTHADVFDIPISPSPTKSRKTPQTEPKYTRGLNLRNRTVRRLARLDSSPSISDNKEDKEPSNDGSRSGDDESESIQDRTGNRREEELADNRDEFEPEPEHDPFPEPVDLFPAEDEDQADHQAVHENRDAQDDAPGDVYKYGEQNEADDQFGEEAREEARDPSEHESEYEDDEEADNQAEEKARDAQDDASDHGSEYEAEEEADDQAGKKARDTQDDAFEDGTEHEDEEVDDHSSADTQNHSTPTQQIANANTFEVQILESAPRNKRDGTHISRDARESQNVSSQLQEVPETPTIQSPRSNQDNESIRPTIFTWLTETTKESVFKDTWEAIRKTRKSLKAHADPSTKEHFRGIIKLIGRLRDLFETMTNDPASASSLKTQCSLIANSVFKETQWIVYTEAPEDEENGAHLVNQLEAHIIPRLIDLIILGFKTYKTINDRGARHFRIILDLIWGSCDRISSLAQMNYAISVSVMARSRRVVHHVKTLKDALKDGRLRETPHCIPPRTLPYKHFELEEVHSHISCGRWTYAEKTALREGLLLYGGEDRYIDIKCDHTIGSQLSERILQDIQSQTVKLGLHDLSRSS
ncbi:uncharacterized protein PGRI_021950 [Penicillium griseofulvum]|uniref:Uncharacterized protein n=1 Tax=Penicillium patulum TaxID=5078 RepID=A0A135LHA0_PENPA|nr:uncharacterized protein PGRI_021950 [Penicillium griseofulvum]KXG48325.1 hypothetical protein PGRI_021950 [Penicillium griseofulvum]